MNTISEPQKRFSLRIEHLYVLIVLVAFGIFVSFIATPPNDFWWHLRAGQIVADQGIPTTNLFAWTLPADTPFIYATWFGEWLFYQLYTIGGFTLIVLVRNLMVLGAFGLVAYAAYRRSGSWRLAALATLLACAMTINNLIIRTQNWSWIPFALFTLLLGLYAADQLSPRALIILPLVMIFWVNVHGAFILGPVLLAIYSVGETLRRLFHQPNALAWLKIGWLYLSLVAAIAATLINPLGFGIFGYVSNLLNNPPVQGLVNEWQPPTIQSTAGKMFYLSILVLLATLAYTRRKPSITDVLLMCAFLWQAWSGQRHVVWFGMVAMPILAGCLAAPRKAGTPHQMGGNPLNTVLASLLILLLLAVQPPFKAIWPFPETYTKMFADTPDAPYTFSATTPIAATEWMRQQPTTNWRVFNEMGYGSYLDWALYPNIQVFLDPRIELYPLEIWQDYQAISKGIDATNTLDQYAVTHVFLDRTLQPKLHDTLSNEPSNWAMIYHDSQSEIWHRIRVP